MQPNFKSHHIWWVE